MLNLSLALQTVENVTGIHLPFSVSCSGGPGLSVRWDGGAAAQITAEDMAALHRGLFLLSRAVKENRPALSLSEARHFAHCGAMLDMSRNGVMTVEAVERWIDRQAALGLNLLMLYTEDTYTIPEYPYFGYLRGRYTPEELRTLDEYAAQRGVELVPCVQTLGHLKQFLQWPSSWPLRDQPAILLIDSEETYRFLDAALASLSSCFRSRRIHIGMDEAHGVGLGRYLRLHGFTDRFDLLTRHLSRVVDLCGKYGLKPMMWSDMFFRLGSPANDYYDLDNHVPDSVIASLPPVEQVYWDYYHTEEDFYDRMMAEHSRMGTAVFAGGTWAWSGFLPNRVRTERTMLPALRVAARRKVDTVFATVWGDDGAETDYLMAIDRLPMFSEACWTGESFSMEECCRAAECLTGLPESLRAAWDHFYADNWEESTGKKLIWSDPLYPCGVSPEARDLLASGAAEALRTLEEYKEAQTRTDLRYTRCLYAALLGKCSLIRDLRAAYEKRDRKAMAEIASARIPEVVAAYKSLMAAHRELWEQHRKRQGWEVLALRYGGAVARLEDVAEEIRRWSEGALPAIPELDEPVLPDGKGDWYNQISTPSAGS